MNVIDEEFKQKLSAAINESVLSILQKIDCDLTVAIDYVPDAPLNVRISTAHELYKEENWINI